MSSSIALSPAPAPKKSGNGVLFGLIVTWVVIAAVFLVLGIVVEVLKSTMTPEDAAKLQQSVDFWIGTNGIVFSIVFLFLLSALVAAGFAIVKEAPGWIRLFEKASQIPENLNASLRGVTQVTTSADDVLRTLNQRLSPLP